MKKPSNNFVAPVSMDCVEKKYPSILPTITKAAPAHLPYRMVMFTLYTSRTAYFEQKLPPGYRRLLICIKGEIDGISQLGQIRDVTHRTSVSTRLLVMDPVAFMIVELMPAYALVPTPPPSVRADSSKETAVTVTNRPSPEESRFRHLFKLDTIHEHFTDECSTPQNSDRPGTSFEPHK